MLVHDFLQDSAAASPNKIALVCGDQRFTYRQLDTLANQLANALQEYGLRRGERVAVYLNNSIEAVVSLFAALKVGGVSVVINRTTKLDKLRTILNDCLPSALITDRRALAADIGASLLAGVESLRSIVACGDTSGLAINQDPRCHDFVSIRATQPGERPLRQNIDLDLACLIYTSGTTGERKGVMCDHSNVVFVTRAVVEYLRNSADEVVLNVLPLSFSYGLYQLLAMFCVGGTLVLEDSFAFPAAVLQKMAQERVTGFAGVPTIYSILLGMDLRGLDLSSLRYLTNAAAGLPIEHVKRLRQTFPKVDLYLMHGLTEVARTMYLPPDQVDLRPGSSGIPIPGTELWIEDETGRRLGPGEVGELVVRGRHVMRGYWNDTEKTAERFRPGPIPGERVCFSGDLFRTDGQGYYYFVSRKDDIIKSRGEKVAPREVENVLCALDGVQEAAVVGVPDSLLGQAVKAHVVARDARLTKEAVIAHCKARLEDYMVPQLVEFCSELPKTETGKVRRRDLS